MCPCTQYRRVSYRGRPGAGTEGGGGDDGGGEGDDDGTEDDAIDVGTCDVVVVL